jgi:hypothetical protein
MLRFVLLMLSLFNVAFVLLILSLFDVALCLLDCQIVECYALFDRAKLVFFFRRVVARFRKS